MINNFTLNGNAISNNKLLKHEIIERLNTPQKWRLGVPTYSPYDSTYSINKTFLNKETEFIKFVEKNFPDYSELFFPDDAKGFVNDFCNNNHWRITSLGMRTSHEKNRNLKLLDFCSFLYFEFLEQAQKKFNKKFNDLSSDFFDYLFDLCIIDLCGNAYEYFPIMNSLGIKRRNNMLSLIMNEWHD